jgi:ABC-type xylose transport system permease subunit
MQPNLKQPRIADERPTTPSDYVPNHPIFYGAIAAIVAIAYTYTLYLSEPTYLISGYENFNWLVFFIMMIMVGVSLRAAQSDKFIEFKPLLNAMYKAFALAYILKYIFVYTLFKYIDPTLLDLVRDYGRKQLIASRDPNWTDQMFQDVVANYNNQPIPIFDFLGVAIHLVLGFIVAIILSFLLKRERPDWEQF